MKIYKDIYKDKTWFTISNFLTSLRIIMTPVIVLGIYYKYWYLVFVLFLIAGFTDLVDGDLARRYNQETFFGKALDPIADKFLIISSFATLAFVDSPSFFIPKWFVFIILFRELVIILGSTFLLVNNIKFRIEPIIWGKLTTFFQLFFILWLFICYFFDWVPEKTYYISLVLLTFFSLFSFFQYIKIGIRSFLRDI